MSSQDLNNLLLIQAETDRDEWKKRWAESKGGVTRLGVSARRWEGVAMRNAEELEKLAQELRTAEDLVEFWEREAADLHTQLQLCKKAEVVVHVAATLLGMPDPTNADPGAVVALLRTSFARLEEREKTAGKEKEKSPDPYEQLFEKALDAIKLGHVTPANKYGALAIQIPRKGSPWILQVDRTALWDADRMIDMPFQRVHILYKAAAELLLERELEK